MKSEQLTTEVNNREARRPVTLVRGDATGGRLAVVELHEVQGQGPPRHLHANEDEIIYVLEGTLTVCVGEDILQATTGTCLFFPRDTEHGYAVESAAARLLVVLTPAGLEGFFGELDAEPSSEGVERLIAVAARYGIAITGPAPTVEGSASGATASHEEGA
ncbi:MAG: cupin domain-containing protein [Chloroflexota bacterium]|nr:cupin domain-containing protein [Chloroflexota bacterium]